MLGCSAKNLLLACSLSLSLCEERRWVRCWWSAQLLALQFVCFSIPSVRQKVGVLCRLERRAAEGSKCCHLLLLSPSFSDTTAERRKVFVTANSQILSLDDAGRWSQGSQLCQVRAGPPKFSGSGRLTPKWAASTLVSDFPVQNRNHPGRILSLSGRNVTSEKFWLETTARHYLTS